MKIAIAAPARKVTPEEMEFAIHWLHDHGFESVFDHRVYSVDNIAAGSDALRCAIIQEYMDRDDIDAIWMARGGYGSIRIIDQLDFSKFIKHPKPIIGFSDVTVFHGKLSRLGIPSIHASMPHVLANKTSEALQSLIDALTGNTLHYTWHTSPLHRLGSVSGVIVGGNLSVFCGLAGSDYDPLLLPDIILFVVDTGEGMTKVDRMFHNIEVRGLMSHVKGVIIGQFTSYKRVPNTFPDMYYMFHEYLRKYAIPVCYDFPVGHAHLRNFPMLVGSPVELNVSGEGVTLLFKKR